MQPALHALLPLSLTSLVNVYTVMPFDPATRTVPIEPTGFASTVAPLVAADAPEDAAAWDAAAVDGAADAAAWLGAEVAPPALEEHAASSRMSGMAAAPMNRCRPVITKWISCLDGGAVPPDRYALPPRPVSRHPRNGIPVGDRSSASAGWRDSCHKPGGRPRTTWTRSSSASTAPS